MALALKFFQESIHLVTPVFSDGETDLVLGILALIDLGLVAALALMVMMSGYENFVSRIRWTRPASSPGSARWTPAP